MPLYTAAFKATLSGIVLLDFSDSMESEPRLDQQRLEQTVHPIRAPFARTLPRGNVSHSLTFSRVIQFPDAGAARAFKLAHALALAAIVEDAPLTLEIANNSGTFTMAHCTLAPGGCSATTKAQLFHANYHLAGGQITGPT